MTFPLKIIRLATVATCDARKGWSLLCNRQCLDSESWMAGCSVVYAANHWPLAVEWHAANHPGTDHACQDLQQADFTALPDHDVLLASPSCQGHRFPIGW